MKNANSWGTGGWFLWTSLDLLKLLGGVEGGFLGLPWTSRSTLIRAYMLHIMCFQLVYMLHIRVQNAIVNELRAII